MINIAPKSVLPQKIRKKLINHILLISSFLILSGCATREEIVYFQDIEELQNLQAPENFVPEIEINDVLRIDVSSLNDEVVEPFNFDLSQSGSGGGGGGNAVLNGYLVEADGTIEFPVLGEVNVVGMTRNEVEKYLTAALREYVTDAVVRVRIVNFKVTVLGETGSQVINVADGRISIPQAIAMSGDVTYDGKRENLLVIRQHDEELIYGRVDLTSAKIFESPYYYLKQNDIIYVEPTYRKVKAAGYITSWQGIVSIFTTAFGLYLLFTR